MKFDQFQINAADKKTKVTIESIRSHSSPFKSIECCSIKLCVPFSSFIKIYSNEGERGEQKTSRIIFWKSNASQQNDLIAFR